MTQRTQVLRHLKVRGNITPIKALHEYGCYRLSDVIFKLRNAGHMIRTNMKQSEAGRKYAEYEYLGGPVYE